MSVNDSMLCSLADARKAAAVYLRENSFLLVHQDSGVSTPLLRREQIDMLERALVLEEENCRLAALILEGHL